MRIFAIIALGLIVSFQEFRLSQAHSELAELRAHVRDDGVACQKLLADPFVQRLLRAK